MDKNTIRIALSSIFLFLSFSKIYDILSLSIYWLQTSLNNYSLVITVFSQIIVGIGLGFALIVYFGKRFKKHSSKSKVILVHLLIFLLLVIANLGLRQLFVKYITTVDNEIITGNYFASSSNSSIILVSIKFLILIYFIVVLFRNSDIKEEY